MIAVPVMMAFQDAEAAKSHVWRTCVIFEAGGSGVNHHSVANLIKTKTP
jgi:hypothetical protein